MDSEVYEAFKLLPRPVLKADYFRYIILYLYGGIYSDTDTICLRPIDTWSDGKEDVDMILGLEGYEPNKEYVCEEEGMARDIQFTQWTIMSRAKHPILLNVINKIKEITPIMINKTYTSYCDVLNWTGPGIWTDAVMDYLSLKNTTELDIKKGKLINGVYILPNTGFNGPDEEYDPEAKVQHLFWGSWKNHTIFKFYQEIDRYFYFRFRC
ncbi:hypothetical protein K502DRAFT_326560 [Neoconidiobolus thromboides FSU 785]|nr:hypothetical protein K502DRAFT_326560 [Neoconidiobolus thromboides FSU 785]